MAGRSVYDVGRAVDGALRNLQTFKEQARERQTGAKISQFNGNSSRIAFHKQGVGHGWPGGLAEPSADGFCRGGRRRFFGAVASARRPYQSPNGGG
jgi:hypothetical protein